MTKVAAIQIVQFNATMGAFADNSVSLLSKIDQTNDLIVCPELTLVGYPPQDLLLHNSFVDRAERAAFNFSEQMENLLILGSPYAKTNKLYNQALVLQRGKQIHSYNKHCLPNESVFDEMRYFQAGADNQPLWNWQVNGYSVPVALCVCQDIWHNDYITRYTHDAQLLICINASPFYVGRPQQRLKHISSLAKKLDKAIIYTNLIGGQDELIFDGTSFAVNRSGEVVCQLPLFQEASAKVSFDLAKADLSSITQTKPLEMNRQHQTHDALVLAIKDYVKKSHSSHVWIGLSGGIDSALTAYLATKALGKEQVHAVMLPYKYTSDTSLEGAQQLVSKLDIDYQIIPIGSLVDACYESLAVQIKDAPPQTRELMKQNAQARIRGLLLLSLSNLLPKSLVLTTSNKSELSMGYSTIYGDMAGAFNPLKDLTKTRLYELCKWINRKSEIIPELIINRPPSAELAHNQKDEDSLPPYEILDETLEKLLAKNLFQEGKEVWQHLQRNEFKRFQSPPGPRITPTSLTKLDWRYPICSEEE